MRKITVAQEDELLEKRNLRRELSLKRLAIVYGVSVDSIRGAIKRATKRRRERK